MRNLLSCSIAIVLCLSALGVDKDEAGRELLQRSFRQADIWANGPLELVAQVTMPQGKKQDLKLTYTISWAGPDKWRAEWSGGGYSRIVVADDGKLYKFSSTPIPPLPILDYERALGLLNGHGFGGPMAAVPNLSTSKVQVSKEKAGKAEVACFRFVHGAPGYDGDLCVEPSSARLMEWRAEGRSLLYSDYITLGNTVVPTAIRQVIGREVVQNSNITLKHDVAFSEKDFAPPSNATVTDYPACKDATEQFELPNLIKKTQPEYPQQARMASHQGTAILWVTIAKDGSIVSLRPFDTTWPELRRSAMDAVKDWKYSPYLRCGKPVEYDAVITVNYSLHP